MRLINIFLAAMAVAVVALGCAKDEVFDTPQVTDYAVEFNVADKGGFDDTTRAVKTAWAAGDQIAIFCRPTASGEYVSDNAKIIYLKYDGSAWSASTVSAALVAEMESSGQFCAIHHRVGSDENITLDNSGTFETYNGGELLYYAGNYTKADGVISLGSITMSLFPDSDWGAGRLFQVSVPGLNAADGWTMAIANDNYTPSESNVTANNQIAHYATYSGVFRFVAENGMVGTWGGDYKDYRECTCVQNGDDISFVFERKNDLANVDANKRYHFYLTNGTAVYTYTIDRGTHDGKKYEKNLEVGHAYLLPAISKWTNPNAPANDEIWYTNGSTTEPTAPTTPSAFGDATIQSNTYNAKKECWVIKFDKDLTEIGESAFEECENLTSVTIPDSVTEIGESAFSDCDSLASVTIPDGVTTIGDWAFYYCTSLTSVTIPDSVTTIGDGAFGCCESLKEFKGKFAADNGRCLIMDNTIIAYANESGTTYTIPDSVTTIGYGAFFNCTSLTSVTIGNSVKTIGEEAFGSCDILTSVTIGDSVMTIGEWAFGNCESLASVTIPDSVTEIGDYTFYNCSSLTSVYCKATTPPSLGGTNVFDNNGSGRKIYVPAGSVDAYKSAEYWSEYADYIFAEGVESAPAKDEIWYTNDSTTEPTVPADPAAFGDATIQSNTYNAEKECWVIKFDKDLTTIGDWAFVWRSSLTSVTIPDSVTTIGEGAFRGCDSLASVTIPDNVTTIGGYAFDGCNSLTSVTIPDSVTTIGEWAFCCCNSLTSVTIPNSVTTIGGGAFSGCDSLKEFKGKFAADNGRCLIKDNTIISYAEASGTTYTIPDSVTTIGEGAFYDCTSLTNVTIPDSVTTIGIYAFGDCEGLASVTIPDSVTTIGEEAFSYCHSLKTVYCKPTTPPAGGSDMFYKNASDRKIYVPAGSVDAYKAKEYWSDYADYIFAEGVESEPAKDEIWYTATAKVEPYDKTVFGAPYLSNVWDSATGKGVITFDGNVTKIGDYAFEECTSLTSVTIPDSVTTIGYSAFNDCGSLTSVTIPNSVKTIGDFAFSWCPDLTSVTIPDSVTTIGVGVFEGCKSLKEFKGKFAADNGRCLIKDNTIIAYANASGTTYTIPDSVTTIGEEAFYYCPSLTSVTIPNSVKTIGNYAFADCEGLASVTIPDSVTTIGDYAFNWCTSLTSVTIPDSVTTIGKSAFSSCKSLKTVYCKPTTPPAGGDYMFYSNASDRKIYVPAGSVDAYKAKEYWSEYKDSIFAE